MDSVVRHMAKLHPAGTRSFDEQLLACIEECMVCFQASAACADACLAEPDVSSMVRCIRTDLDCSDTCVTTAAALSRRTEWDLDVLRSTVEACLVSCRVCAEECERHASHHEHCRVAAEVCRRCEVACSQLLAALPATP